MDEVVLKQTVHPNVKWMIAYPFILALGIYVYTDPSSFYILFFPIALAVYGFDFVFAYNNKSYLSLTLMGYSVLRLNKKFINLDYVSVVRQAYTRGRAPFGFSPQILSDERYTLFIIKLFSENENETIFESESKEEVLRLGDNLSKLFGVDLYDALN